MRKLTSLSLATVLLLSMATPVKAEEAKESKAEEAKVKVEEVLEKTEEKAKEAGKKVEEKAEEAGKKVEEKVEEVKGKVEEKATEVKSESRKVKVSVQKVTLNGAPVTIYGYNIDGENYFKLRDLAAVLKDTEAKFGVEYKDGVVTLKDKEDYKVLDTDQKEVEAEAEAMPTNDKVLVGDKALEAKAFKINGNNYYRLRDLGKALEFGVDYDEATNTVLLTDKMEKAEVKDEKAEDKKVEEKKVEEKKAEEKKEDKKVEEKAEKKAE